MALRYGAVEPRQSLLATENRQRLPGMGRGGPGDEAVTPQSRSDAATRAKQILAIRTTRGTAHDSPSPFHRACYSEFDKRRNFDDADDAGTGKCVGSLMWPIAAEAFRTLPRHTNTRRCDQPAKSAMGVQATRAGLRTPARTYPSSRWSTVS